MWLYPVVLVPLVMLSANKPGYKHKETMLKPVAARGLIIQKAICAGLSRCEATQVSRPGSDSSLIVGRDRRFQSALQMRPYCRGQTGNVCTRVYVCTRV